MSALFAVFASTQNAVSGCAAFANDDEFTRAFAKRRTFFIANLCTGFAVVTGAGFASAGDAGGGQSPVRYFANASTESNTVFKASLGPSPTVFAKAANGGPGQAGHAPVGQKRVVANAFLKAGATFVANLRPGTPVFTPAGSAFTRNAS